MKFQYQIGTKVLDFGLAKIEQSLAAAANDETLTRALTQEGSILGTLQYMAPEQLQGKATDTRADIFSFGCVLYEMLSGKRAFDGANTASVIAAILERPAPSVSEVAPTALDRLVRKCLAKDPDDRWQTARDLKDELVWIASGPTEAPRQTEVQPTWKNLVWPLAACALAAVTALGIWMLKPTAARPVSRLVIAMDSDEHLANLDTPAVAISPDGANIAYVASRGSGPAQLFLRPLNALKSEPMAGTEGAAAPFFSPDSQRIAFFADGKLKKVVIGGVPVALSEVGTGITVPGGTWGPDNSILFQAVTGTFLALPASGGTARRMTVATKNPIWRWPEFTPNGAAVIFSDGANGLAFGTNASIAITALSGGGTEKDLIAGGVSPHLAATGDITYVQNGTLMAVPFNVRRLELAGSPVPVLEGVRESTNGAAQYDLSASGTLVYIPGGLQGSTSRMAWVDREGKEQPIAAPAHSYSFPRISPDGRRVAVTIAETATDIWIYDTDRDALSRATFGGTANANPVWSPDGRRFAFNSNRAGPAMNLFWQYADGSGAAERLTTSQLAHAPGAWSTDGQTIAFMEVNSETGLDIWTLTVGNREARPFLKTRTNETAPRFSPDGHWIAYTSDESGRGEVYVQPYPGPGGKWQISTEGGTEPVWNPNGHELFYRFGDRMMAVAVTLQPGFYAGKPKMLFQGPWTPSPLTTANYDVSSDGKRFLMLKPGDQDEGPRHIVVVQNWLEELKKRKK